MSQYWRCDNCGAILKKGLTPDKIEALFAEGKEITGTATCGKCSSKFDQSEVYAGHYDIDENELAEMVRKARETRAMQQQQAEAAAAAQPEPEPGPEDDYADDNVPEMDAEGYDDYPDEDEEPQEDVLAGVNFAKPDLAPDRKVDAHRDFLEDLDAGVDLAAQASGTLVDYAAVTDEGYPRYIVPPGVIDEFQPQSDGHVACDICARPLDTPEGYLLGADEVVASPDYISFVTERWTLNGWLAPGIEPDAVYDQVSQDVRKQAGPAPWLVCENCILMFPQVRKDGLVEAARKVREWWPADGMVLSGAAPGGAPAHGGGAVGYDDAAAGVGYDDEPMEQMFDDDGAGHGGHGGYGAGGGGADDQAYYDQGFAGTADVSADAALLRDRTSEAWADDPDDAGASGFDDLDDDAGYDDVPEDDLGHDPYASPGGGAGGAAGGYASPYDAMDQGYDGQTVADDDEYDPSMQTMDASQGALFRERGAPGGGGGFDDPYGQQSASPYDAPGFGEGGFDDVDGFRDDVLDDGDDPSMQTIATNVGDIARVRDAARGVTGSHMTDDDLMDDELLDDDDPGFDVLDDEDDALPADPSAQAIDELDRIMLDPGEDPGRESGDDDEFMDFNPSAMGIDAYDEDDLDDDDDER